MLALVLVLVLMRSIAGLCVCQVFTVSELTATAAVIKAQPHHVTVISGEVYEHLVFDGAMHTHFANIPGMCVTALIQLLV